VHVVVPEGIDDGRRPSGGNAYDRRVCDGLRGRGWTVHEHPVGRWPGVDAAAHDRLARVLRDVPDGATVLVDGLVGSAASVQLAAAAPRLRAVLLVHLPLGVCGDAATRAAEHAALMCVAAVVTPSRWTRSWLLDRYGLSTTAVHVAVPGVDPAPLASGTPSGGRLLCVAAVTPLKGHDLLMAALASVDDLPWRCTFVGSLEVDAAFARAVQDATDAAGIGDRVVFTGPLGADGLARAYAGADLLVLGSRAESWGMVAAEALARGMPVLGPDVGGLPEAVGAAIDGVVPGLLVPRDSSAALGGTSALADRRTAAHRLAGGGAGATGVAVDLGRHPRPGGRSSARMNRSVPGSRDQAKRQSLARRRAEGSRAINATMLGGSVCGPATTAGQPRRLTFAADGLATDREATAAAMGAVPVLGDEGSAVVVLAGDMEARASVGVDARGRV
jgi:hypothetical protein